MTDRDDNPERRIADTLSDLSDQTRELVRQEIATAQREMVTKAKQAAPATGLLAASGLCALLAVASAYRLGLRLLERRLPPAGAALVATVFYVGTAGAAAIAGQRWLRDAPVPFPTETAQATRDAVMQSSVSP